MDTEKDIVNPEENIVIANMITQRGVGQRLDGKPPIDYNALETALTTVNKHAMKYKATVHMPKIGSGLAGGDWNIIKDIIDGAMKVPTYIYEFE